MIDAVELTTMDGMTIWLNRANIDYMKRVSDATEIYMNGQHNTTAVLETPEEILRRHPRPMETPNA